MSDKTKIEWSDATWNPVTGCTKVSPGCDNCYAQTFAERWRGTPGHYFEGGFDVQLREDKLGLPLRWKKPRKIFVNSMSDLFHDKIEVGFIAQVFAVMAATPQHTYQLLTKRHGRMRSLLSSPDFDLLVADEWAKLHTSVGSLDGGDSTPPWPLPNVWLGVSVENQKWADIRIPALLDTPAAVRWISAEPLVGPIDLDQPRCDVHGRIEVITDSTGREWCEPCSADGFSGELSYGHWLDSLNGGLNWVVAGGESGPGARPMHPAWVRSVRDQCQEAGVPFLFKQWGDYIPEPLGAHIITRNTARSARYADLAGGHRPANVGARAEAATCHRVGKKNAGRELDGRTWDEFPQEVAVHA